jgi:hypothetical protein
MDFQGQGLASTGETEALAIIDSFTKVVTVIPLSDRQAHTLVPKLLDAIYFQRGATDVIHSDDAPEFLSELMTAIAAATDTSAPPPVSTTRKATAKSSHGGDSGIAP